MPPPSLFLFYPCPIGRFVLAPPLRQALGLTERVDTKAVLVREKTALIGGVAVAVDIDALTHREKTAQPWKHCQQNHGIYMCFVCLYPPPPYVRYETRIGIDTPRCSLPYPYLQIFVFRLPPFSRLCDRRGYCREVEEVEEAGKERRHGQRQQREVRPGASS